MIGAAVRLVLKELVDQVSIGTLNSDTIETGLVYCVVRGRGI